MTLFLAMLFIWFFVVQSGRSLYGQWRKRHLLEPARSVSDIMSADYFRHLSPAQFQSLVSQVIRARQYTLLGNPYWGRSEDQGYLWKKGKKTILMIRPECPLTEADLDSIAKNTKLARADNCIVFSPFSNAPKAHRAGVEVLAGKKLVKWFAMLDNVTPPIAVKKMREICRCGASMKSRISRAGFPLLVCSMAPDCRVKRQLPELSINPLLRAVFTERGFGRRNLAYGSEFSGGKF